MKKIICLIVGLLLLAGCSKAVEEPPIELPNPKGYMTEPQILINSGHHYKEESWSGEEVELKEESINLQGDSFFTTIIFQGSIPEDKLKEAVQVEGFAGKAEITITPSEGKTVFYACYRNLEMNKPYKLVISKDLADSEGRTLKADVQKQITLSPDTTALYSLITSEQIYSELGWQNVYDAFAVGNMNWSPDPKTIVVDFSAEVDKASVEQSIRDGFNRKAVKYSVEWNNPQKLTLRLEFLKSGNPEPYNISMGSAKDSAGNPIYGNLYFVISSPNYLGSIDIKSKEDSVVHKFPDKRYMTVQSSKVNNSIILDDTEAKYVFNLASKTISKININREYTMGIPSLSFLFSWLDSDTMIMLNRTDGTVVDYSTIDGSSKELFAVPIEILKSNIIEISASPDGRYLAIAYETLPEGQVDKHDFIIEVYDYNGNKIYQGKNLFVPRYLEIFGAVANMGWIDDETLILEDNITKAEQLDYNVISINIKLNQKSIIAEHAFKPNFIYGKNVIKVESFKDFGSGDRSIDIINKGKKINDFKAQSFQYDNFFFADENTLIYNEGEKILVYYIDVGRSEQLGKGYIIGLSRDGSKLYYMTNHRMLYYID